MITSPELIYCVCSTHEVLSQANNECLLLITVTLYNIVAIFHYFSQSTEKLPGIAIFCWVGNSSNNCKMHDQQLYKFFQHFLGSIIMFEQHLYTNKTSYFPFSCNKKCAVPSISNNVFNQINLKFSHKFSISSSQFMSA